MDRTGGSGRPRPGKEKEVELGMLPVRIAWKQAVLVAVLVVAGAWQLSIVAQKTILPWTKATWRTRELNGMGRSARFYLGRAGAEYLNFLRSVVPEDGPIVIPPGAVQFSEQNALQFYLMPRAAVGCPCKSQETLPKACVHVPASPEPLCSCNRGIPAGFDHGRGQSIRSLRVEVRVLPGGLRPSPSAAWAGAGLVVLRCLSGRPSPA